MTRSFLIESLVRQDFIDRYSGSVFGVLWAFVTPLLQIVIFTVVFGSLLGPRLPGQGTANDYVMFLVSGMLPWTTFTSTVLRTTTVFTDKASIITKIPVRLWAVAGHIAIVEALLGALTLTIFIALVAVLSDKLTPYALYLPLILLYQQALGLAIGLGCAIVNVFIRDIRELVGVGLMLWFWLTPVVYATTILPLPLQRLQAFNPAFWFTEQYHRILAYGTAPDLVTLGITGIGIAVMIGLLLLLLNRLERDIRDLV